jgi:Rad3-related DNA helicase
MDRREDHLIELNDAYERLLLVINNFAFLLDAQGANVFWFEYNTDNPLFFRIKSAPLDIAEKLAFGLYDQMETVIMTSATLAVARDFGYISERLGLALDQRERLRTFIADSPFDHIRQSALVVPTFLPSPNEGDFIDETGELLYEIACGARRGMLVLFTSRGHLYRAYYDLRDRFTREGITLLAQGVDGSRSLLLRRFKEEPKSVLFGTDSFWEGVDVPGAALEIVVISKLPFAVPSEPVIQAQMEEIEKTGGNPFMEYSVPSAAIKLRQGAGRLIRHRKDRGVIVLFDKRVHTKRYGSLFLRSLPGKELRAENRNRVVEQITGWFSRLD